MGGKDMAGIESLYELVKKGALPDGFGWRGLADGDGWEAGGVLRARRPGLLAMYWLGG
jgi:hypothetical protein